MLPAQRLTVRLARHSWSMAFALGGWLLVGCDSPGHDDQDALDDTFGVVDSQVDAIGDAIVLQGDGSQVPDVDAGFSLLGGGATVPLTQLASAIAAWECQRIVVCGCVSAWQTKPDLNACIAQLTPAIASAWSNGGLVARGDLIPLCVAALNTASAPCAVAKLTSLQPCLAALRWPGKTGDACNGSGPFLCADGGLCEQKVCSGNHLGLIALGQACSNPFACGDAECVVGGAGKGLCAVPIAVGKACGNLNDCAQPALCKSGVCTLPAKAGEQCATVSDCGPGLDCVAGACTTPATCSPGSSCGNSGQCLGGSHATCTGQKTAGGGCKTTSECVASAYCDEALHGCVDRPTLGKACGNGAICSSGLGCDPGKTTCQNLPKSGQKCLIGPDGSAACQPGSACSLANSKCAAPPLENEPCAAGNVCSDADVNGDGKKGDLVCNQTVQGAICTLKLAIGASCQNEACVDGAFCNASSGKCAPVYGAGNACTSASACGTGASCAPTASGKLLCGPIPTLGAPCLTDCATGLYCENGTQAATCQPPVCADWYAVQ